MRKTPVVKDPKVYAGAIEYGTPDIPERPLFRKSLEDYEETFKLKFLKATNLIKAAWS